MTILGLLPLKSARCLLDMKSYYRWIIFILVPCGAANSFAVEVAPNIGFRKYQAQNGSEYDPHGSYRTKMDNSQYSMNSQIFHDSQVGKMVPEFDSVGLDFTFKVD